MNSKSIVTTEKSITEKSIAQKAITDYVKTDHFEDVAFTCKEIFI